MRVVEHKEPSRWKIELETRTLGYGMLPYQVEFQPDRTIKVWAKAPGVAVLAYTLLRDGPTPNETNVVYSLYIDLSGIPRLLVSESSLRQKQEHMVDVTLRDLYRAFAPR